MASDLLAEIYAKTFPHKIAILNRLNELGMVGSKDEMLRSIKEYLILHIWPPVGVISHSSVETQDFCKRHCILSWEPNFVEMKNLTLTDLYDSDMMFYLKHRISPKKADSIQITKHQKLQLNGKYSPSELAPYIAAIKKIKEINNRSN